MKKIIGIIGVSIIGGAIVFSGVYNVSATDKHWDITTKFLELVRDRSVHLESENIIIPDLSSIEMISNGAKNYNSMCVQCHLAPGAENTELSQALYPKPLVFHQNNDKHKYSAAETFWVIKNGFKMTGMPAWGEFHTDQQLWEMTAFLQKVNGMSTETYKNLVGEGGHSHSDGAYYKPSNDSMMMNKDNDNHKDPKPVHDDTDGHGHN